ncbi:hypothetical protein DUI87_22773 [Hirundo rustica rustica]|uniref:Peptidase A2 domain-containing protein n=1 Tax=Hirundo rustica rustica TaxID=333673 RepID=A0A3M0JIM4_HIRRU|nr:hypothetical protein DUI87_22773 [Hirundo rustica rustica]
MLRLRSRTKDQSQGDSGFGSTGPPQVHYTAVLTKDHPEMLCTVSMAGAMPSEIHLRGLLDTGVNMSILSLAAWSPQWPLSLAQMLIMGLGGMKQCYASDNAHQPQVKVRVRNLVTKQWEGPYDLIAMGLGYACVSTDTGTHWLPSKSVLTRDHRSRIRPTVKLIHDKTGAEHDFQIYRFSSTHANRLRLQMAARIAAFLKFYYHKDKTTITWLAHDPNEE